jgi:nucleoside-diphosphate-sugar epimerase
MTAGKAALKNARILITGGGGFIATNFIGAVLDQNKVVVLDTLERNSIALAPFRKHKNLTVIQGDVRDLNVVRKAVDGIDYVLHMAAVAGVQTVVNNPVRTFHVNLIGTHNVLSALMRRGKVKRFVDFSTSEVYGPHVFRADEKGMTTQGPVYQPRWFYAVSKLASEFLTRACHLEFGMPTTCIRPFNVYGPYQLGEGAVRNFIFAALTGRPLVVHGEGDQIRSWCYVSDMVEAIIACLTREQAVGGHFNIGNPRATTSILELVPGYLGPGPMGQAPSSEAPPELIEALDEYLILFVDLLRRNQSKSRIVFRKINHPDVEVRVPSIKEAERRLGFKPVVDLKEGLSKTINWYRHANIVKLCES